MRILSITSGKGGVGKTNMAANLGIALSQLGSRVVLFDADLGLANLDVVLGTSAEYSLHHAIDGFAGEPQLFDFRRRLHLPPNEWHFANIYEYYIWGSGFDGVESVHSERVAGKADADTAARKPLGRQRFSNRVVRALPIRIPDDVLDPGPFDERRDCVEWLAEQ